MGTMKIQILIGHVTAWHVSMVVLTHYMVDPLFKWPEVDQKFQPSTSKVVFFVARKSNHL